MTLKEVAFSGSREQVISEEAFREVLEEASAGVLSLREAIREGIGREWSRPFISRLIREVHNLRTVLNDFEAHENRTYSYFMEIVAGIRGFSHIVYILTHLRERYTRSPVRECCPPAERFVAGTMETLAWCGDNLRKLFAALLDECQVLGIRLPAIEPVEDESSGPEIRRLLPHNIGEEELAEEGEKVAQVASNFLKFAESVRSIHPNGLFTWPELREFVRGKLDEEHARKLESTVHAIQSKYDTYIQGTPSEAKDPDLKRLRSVISLSLHLLEITTYLVHFYERHENDIRSEQAKERIAKIVDKQAVLDRAVNYAFRNIGWLAEEGARISARLVPAYTSIQELTFPIPPNVRLHIRPAALIAAIVGHHGTPVTMQMGGDRCDASSVTDVIFLAGTHLDAREATFRGDERPLADLRILFGIGLEDDGREDLEKALPYLVRRR